MTQPSGQNPYPGYGQQPYQQQGYGGYGQMPPGQYPPTAPQYPGQPGAGQHQGAPNTAPVARTDGGVGSSRALPIITGVGLAIGVFVGLLIVRGLGSDSETSEAKAPVAAVTIDAGVKAEEKPVAEAPPPPDAGPPPPPMRPVTLDFDIKQKGVTLTVDGEEVKGRSHQVQVPEGGSKTVTIVANAEGYQELTLNQEVHQKDANTNKVKIRLERKPRETASSGDPSDVTKPETTKPETTKPSTTKPETTKPSTTKPETTKPSTTKPDSKKNKKPKDKNTGPLIDL